MVSRNTILNYHSLALGARRTSPSQFETMLDYLEQHPYLLSQNTNLSKEVRNKMWFELTQKLNEDPNGPQKTDTLWRKTWKDWKCYVKNKARRVNVMRTQIRDGPWLNDEFSPLEERLLNMLGEQLVKEEEPKAKDEESNIVFKSARFKKLLELAKRQSKEIEELVSLENTEEGPVIFSVSSIQSDEEGEEMNGEDEDYNDSDGSNEKRRQTSYEVDISQNSDTYPTTDEEQESATSTLKQTLYTPCTKESSKHKWSPTIFNSKSLFGDRSASARLSDLSRLKFTPLSLLERQSKGSHGQNTSSTILKDQRPLLEHLAAIKRKRKATGATSNTSKQVEVHNTNDSTVLLHQPPMSIESKKASRVEEPSEYGGQKSTHLERELFAEREAAARERRATAEERLAAAEDRKATAQERQAAAEERKAAAEERRATATERKVAAEEKFLVLEELKMAVAERKAAAQERIAATTAQKMGFLKRTLDYEVRLKKWKYFSIL